MLQSVLWDLLLCTRCSETLQLSVAEWRDESFYSATGKMRYSGANLWHMWKMELMNSEDRKHRYQRSYSLSAAAGTTKKRMVIIAALWRVSEDLRKELTSVDIEHSLCSAHQLKYLWMKVRCGLSKLQSPDCLQNTAWRRTQPGWVTTWLCVCGSEMWHSEFCVVGLSPALCWGSAINNSSESQNLRCQTAGLRLAYMLGC